MKALMSSLSISPLLSNNTNEETTPQVRYFRRSGRFRCEQFIFVRSNLTCRRNTNVIDRDSCKEATQPARRTNMSAQGAMHQVQGVNFSFYTEKELEALSVCQVTSSSTYDQLGNCIQGGLYSPEMGPATMRARNCSTCGLSFRECPGHFGHIKLCVPVWNPQLFNTLYRLLRYKCFNCNRLSMTNGCQTLIVQIQLIQGRAGR